MFADIASPGTMRNLRSSPFIEINLIDPFFVVASVSRAARRYTGADRNSILSRKRETVDPSFQKCVGDQSRLRWHRRRKLRGKAGKAPASKEIKEKKTH